MKITMTDRQLDRHVLTQVLDAQASLVGQLRIELERSEEIRHEISVELSNATKEMVTRQRDHEATAKTAAAADARAERALADVCEVRARLDLIEKQRDQLLSKDRIWTKDREEIMCEIGNARRACAAADAQRARDLERISIQATNYQRLMDRYQALQKRANAARRRLAERRVRK